jgi:hypothetical protein
MNDLVPFIALVLIVIFLMVDRYLLTEQHRKEKDKLLEELSRATKAVISKNANEYVMTTSIDKVPQEPAVEKDPDEIPEEALSDEEFLKAVQKGNKE